ncbi:hypothetical protein L873DRAFT_846897 [Choiromyces venosus 120613-1]|uniref:Uncharacterized protein n=1 Tax=Choiromyces venosus 120613-1 TaxID=1336337 RepID=A0A3N4JT52_9PEZI|nr:hypothetical protein L873DRAFT_846897 [Choiromyces venosus 120613-1]
MAAVAAQAHSRASLWLDKLSLRHHTLPYPTRSHQQTIPPIHHHHHPTSPSLHLFPPPRGFISPTTTPSIHPSIHPSNGNEWQKRVMPREGRTFFRSVRINYGARAVRCSYHRVVWLEALLYPSAGAAQVCILE